ncbi:MAG: hypothetical protein Q7T60_17235 [Sphingopyxis sp.]|nr:hypothetical protein [Sphingopyxis sp.]
MPKTRAELVNKAISLLQQEGAGQSIDTEDFQTFDDAVEPLLAELSFAHIITVGDVEAIDDAVFLPLARLLMNEAGEDFGRPTDPAFRQENENRIRRVLAGEPLYTPARVEYF